MKSIITLTLLLTAGTAAAQSPDDPSIADDLRGTWTIKVGFGEIPFLAGSFKPSIAIGHHFNDYVSLAWTVQLRDELERDGESFNAQNLELGGLRSSRERTGVRSLLAARFRPHRYSPFLSVGVLFNGTDTETMQFDSQSRRIGEGTYDGALTVVQRRRWAIRPSIGVGYAVTFANHVTLEIELAGAFFMKPTRPIVDVEGQPLAEADRRALEDRADDAFSGNFHNRYHMFQLAAGYAW